MTELFTRRLLASCGLEDDDAKTLRKALRLLPNVDAGATIRGGDSGVVVLISGLAYLGRIGLDGERTVTGLLLPGDICDLGLFKGSQEHEATAVTRCSVAHIPSVPLMTLCLDRPSIMRAFLVSTLIENAILREWMVGVSRLDAARRTARLFCELHARMQAIGQCVDGSLPLPLTQPLLADALGLSTVHVNRSLKHLRLSGLVSTLNGLVNIPDIDALRSFADFDASYLSAPPQMPLAHRGEGDLASGANKRSLH